MAIINRKWLVGAVLLAGCATIAGTAIGDDYEPLEFHVDGDAIVARGEIDASAIDAFDDVLEQYPDIKTLVLQYVPGSVDDNANLVLARTVHEEGFTTIVPGDGLVASGGTDLFLAGTTRVLHKDACVGVHSWADENGEGKDVPRGNREHRSYLSYYDSIEIDQEFYWYTLEVATAQDMHWMSSDDISQYDLANDTRGYLAVGDACWSRLE
jgi:hypothetical protein